MTARKADILDVLERQVRARRENRLLSFQPYERQAAFFELGAAKRERLLMAGNQVGKSEAGAFEAALHLTGLYPKWWVGKRFDHPIRAWAAGESGLLVRDVSQTKLCGLPGGEETWGTGSIPKALLLGKAAGHGVSDAYDNIRVRHASGGVSTLGFKTYEQGRSKFQGSTLDWIWLDEEPPAEIYSEALARLTGDGCVWTTCTPLLGYTPFISRFLRDASPEARRDRGVVRMGLRHAEHFSDIEKERRLAGYPTHERAARENGDPMLGSGAVFEEVIESDISTRLALSEVPKHWTLLWGIDFGIAHPFAAVLIAWDRDADCLYILDAFKMTGGTPLNHAARMRSIAANVPVAWPHDGTAREKGSGEPLAALYKAEGLVMLPQHATHASGGYSTEAGVMEMLGRMRDGRFKVAAHLVEWFDEFRGYHRKDGQIIKLNDDLMSATRIGVMAHRHARAVPIGSKVMRRTSAEPEMARDIDFPLF
ncbi:MAG: terminase family protein [Stellaceae bacterium]